MRKSKIIFAVISAIVVAACVIVLLISREDKDQSNDKDSLSATKKPSVSDNRQPTQSDGTTPNNGQTQPSTGPTVPDGMEYEKISLSEDVTVVQVEADTHIDRTTVFTEDHPEYVDMEDPVSCDAGCVFKNDKVISITIYDTKWKEEITYSFGYITGECNRFLYLNPVAQSDTFTQPFIFKFISPTQGSVHTVEYRPDSLLNTTGLVFRRTIDTNHLQNAGYTDPQHPGTFWVVPTNIVSPVTYIDVLVLNAGGKYMATLRLTIIYDPIEGTFAIADLDNRDIRSPYSESVFTKQEQQYILDLALEIGKDPESMRIAGSVLQHWNMDHTIDEVLIDVRTDDTGLYFEEFINAPYLSSKFCDDYMQPGDVVIAVTLRDCLYSNATTLYFQVTEPPTLYSHGTYKYIGRDYISYQHYRTITTEGYTGTDD